MNKEIGINLESLFDLSAKLNTEASEEFIHNSVLLSLMGKLAVLKSAVFAHDGEKFTKSVIKGQCNITQIPTKLPKKMVMVNEVNNIALKENGFKYIIPLLDDDKFLAVILLGDKISGKPVTKIEKEYIKLVSSIASISIKNSRNINKLKAQKFQAEKKSQLLESIFSISREFSSILDNEKIINLLKYSLMGQLLVNKFALVLAADDKIELVVNLFDESPNQNFINRVTELARVDTPDNLYFKDEISDEEYNYLNAVGVGVLSPMQVQGNSRAWLVLGKKLNGEEFTNDNLSFIESVGNLAINALENNRLIKEEIARKQLESEMNLAFEIQQRLLPDKNPMIKGYDIAGFSKPSRTVGGDYYDFIQIDDNNCFIVIADVSGKGLPAAMIMANLQSTLRVLVPLKLELKDIILNINKLLYENTAPDKFVTLFCGVLNHQDGSFEYINAGHNPPYLISNNSHNQLKEGGLILGLLDSGIDYQIGKVKLNQKDMIFLFTDGVNEAQDSELNEFGNDNLISFIKYSKDLGSEKMLKALSERLMAHSSGNQFDDITAISIKKL